MTRIIMEEYGGTLCEFKSMLILGNLLRERIEYVRVKGIGP